MSRYPYELIPRESDIRILRILAGSSGEIVCELKPVRFGQLQYVALSYVWGSYEEPTTMRKIIIQEETRGTSLKQRAMAVRRNLFGALEQLRHPTKDINCWADAICVDFKNVEERESQLALTYDIYQSADRVMHWLGHQEEYTVNAFKCVKMLRETGFGKSLVPEQLHQLLCFHQLLANTWFSRRWIIQEVAFARTAVLFSGSCSVYWSVFTEAAVIYFAFQDRIEALALEVSPSTELCRFSTQAAKVLLNVTTSISRSYQTHPWESLRTLSKKTPAGSGMYEEKAGFQLEARNVTDLSKQEQEIIEEYDRKSTIQYDLSLQDLVQALYLHEVSDYRDIVYAVLSLAADTKQHQPKTTTESMADLDPFPKRHHNIQPDYSKDVFEVFKDFTKYCTQRHSNYPLDIICQPWVPRSIHRMFPLSESSKNSDVEPSPFEALGMEELRWVYTRKLASWMPTTEKIVLNSMQSPESRNVDPLVGPPNQPVYHATRSFEIDVSFGELVPHSRNPRQKSPHEVPRTISDGTLSARGIQLDIIDSLSSRYNGIIKEDWLLLGGWSGRRLRWKSQQPIPDAFWRTLVANRDLSGGDPVDPEFKEACKLVLDCRDERNNIITDSLIHQSSDIVSKFLQRVNDVAWNRRMFRTKRLKRLGLSPVHATKGDIISVLYGCSVPVILRKLRDSKGTETGAYELIGECYFDGAMDGESVTDACLKQARKDGNEKVFVLR